MTQQTGKSFVGFGFGPIQSGLFLFEAFRSGNFSRYVVAEVDEALVQAVRNNGGRYTLNIAAPDAMEQVTVEGVELYNPRDPRDRPKLLAAIAQADELATALPSVDFFDTGQPADVAALLAEGLSDRRLSKPAVIYTAENHNHAAEILAEKLAVRATKAAPQEVQILNTVIGKMSGVIADPAAIARIGLKTLTPVTPKAVLVERFNRILISRITLPGFRRGLEVFIEKDDLLPFEEAKLYGHNAIHAMLGYLAELRGLETMAQVADHPDLLEAGRRAFAESGEALVRRHGHLGDPLFTAGGYRAYAQDLLQRMVCPTLNDLVARVTRDHVRKLGLEDRLYGTMRLALSQGVQPVNMALGAAAGVLSLIRHGREINGSPAVLPRSPEELTAQDLRGLLVMLWGDRRDEQTDALVQLTWEAIQRLHR